jgi:hypothetical protein
MAMAGHVIDGCLDPWDMVPSLRLHDLCKTHTDFAESSLSTTTFVLAMNKTTYDRLSRDLKAVIDNNSGQFAAGMAGAMWDTEAKAVADMVRDRGDPVTMLAADEVAQWRKATEPVVATWLKDMKGRKLDGGKLLASVRTLLDKYVAEPEPQPSQPQQPSRPVEPKVGNELKPAAQQAPQAPQAAQAAPVKTEAADLPKPTPPSAAPSAKRTPPKQLDIPL